MFTSSIQPRTERNHVIETTSPRQHQAWAERVLPPVEQVSDRVWSVPITCEPFPVRFTYCYIVVGAAEELLIIDPGMRSAAGAAQLRSGLEEAGLVSSRITGIVVTHFHPDHLGAAQ